jgi:HEPN domain-containing protein
MSDLEPASPAPEEAGRWLAKADDDLAVARLIRSSSIGAKWAVCFHAQQAAEKAIKGVLVSQGIDFPRSHALDSMAALLAPGDAPGMSRDALALLTPWAVAGRYPEDIPEPSDEQCRSCLEAAETIVGAARRLVRSGPE